MNSYLFWIAVLSECLELLYGANIEVCTGEEFRLTCSQNEIILVTSAEYGRKEVGRCITEADDFMGCTNDVLPVLDRWCSGRRDCSFLVPNDDLEKANVECLQILKMYLQVDYTCFRVDTKCTPNAPNRITRITGNISSYAADSKGCGTSNSPWIITASPGQTISLRLIDFSAHSETSSTCPHVYGYARERALGINYTICGGRNREGLVYTSTTNNVELYIASRSRRGKRHFIIEYSVTGCPEIERPAHAWYKREGNEAVIGCESNDNTWRLTCTGNTWQGEIGNCSGKDYYPVAEHPQAYDFQPSSAVIMTAVAGGALVLVVITIVTGVVYIKKYRIRQETKYLTKTYSTLEKNAKIYYEQTALNRATDNPALWDGTLATDPLDSSNVQCTCATLQMRDSLGTTSERQSLYSSIKSNQ